MVPWCLGEKVKPTQPKYPCSQPFSTMWHARFWCGTPAHFFPTFFGSSCEDRGDRCLPFICISHCQITNFTKFKINSRNLGGCSFAQVRSVRSFVLASACHQLPATAFWGKTQNISAYLATTFLKTPKCKALGSACWHFGISISSIQTLIWSSSFCQPFLQGSKLAN